MKNTEPTYHELSQKISELEKLVGFYKSIAYHSNDWEVFRNEQGKIVFLNKGFENITGFKADDMINGTLCEKDVIHPDDWNRVQQAIKSSANQKAVKDLEFRIVRKDKIVRHISLYAIPVFENGQFRGIRTSARDITDQKSYIELAQSKEKFQKYIASSPTAVFLANEQGKYLYANAAACKLLGYSSEELLNLSIAQIVPPQKLPASFQNFELLKQHGKTKSFETQLTKKDGTFIDVILDNVRISTNEYIAFVKDISAIKENEKKLKQQIEEYETLNEEYKSTIEELQNAQNQAKESEFKFRQMYENTSMGIAVVSLDFAITQANKAYCQMLGYTEDELIGKTLADITQPSLLTENLDLQNKLKQGLIPSYQLEKQFIHKKGHIVYGLLNASVIKDANNRPLYFLGNVQDITSRKKAENLLIQEKDRAQQSERKFKNQYNFTKALTNYLPIPLFFKDKQARYLGCNPAFENFSGMQQSQIIGKTVCDIWQTDALERYHQKSIELIADDNEFSHNEIMLTDAQNNKRHYSSYQSVYFDDNDQPAGIVGVLIDTTERKNTELLLRQNADRLKSLYELNQFLHTDTTNIYNFALEKSLQLCNSTIGFFGLLNPEETIVSIQAWSESANQICPTKDKTMDFEVDETGFWGKVVISREPLIENNLQNKKNPQSSIPAKHPEIKNYLSIPILDKDKIVALVTVANKEGDYNQTDVQELSLLMEGVINIIKQQRYENEILIARDKAEQSESFLKAMVSSINEIVVARNLNNEVMFFNDEFNNITQRLFGINAYKGLNTIKLLPKDRQQYWNQQMQKVLNGQVNIQMHDWQFSEHETRFYETSHYPIFNNQQVVGILEITRDITQQKQVEIDLLKAKQKAEESEFKVRGMFQNTQMGLIFCDAKGQILEINKAIIDILGSPSIEATKQINLLTFKPLIDAGFSEKLQQSIHRQISISGEIKYKSKWDVLVYMKYQLIPLVVNNKLIGVWINLNNFTDLWKSKQELIEAKEKAEESSRLKTAFLQNISHEIRTPLNAICGFSGMLDKANLTDEKRKSFVSIIQTSSNQLLAIVSDILTISSLETNQEKPQTQQVCINNIIVDLLAVFKQQSANQNVSLYTKQPLSDRQAEIYTDKTKLTQILTNLISNALKFTHEGFIEFGYSLLKQTTDGTATDTLIEFYVKDTGIGIQPNQLDNIFERFRQADLSINKRYGGTGLGLSISKGFVELLGGNIRVESQPDNGSVFYFTIPYRPVNKTNIQQTNTEPKTIPMKTKPVILVAEDEEFNFLYIEELLKEGNYQIIHAKNGQETVALFKSNSDISLILMDIKMPIMDGHTAAKIIKQLNPDIPIVAQSAYALEQEIEKYSGIFDDYLTKPIVEEVLLEKVKQILQ